MCIKRGKMCTNRGKCAQNSNNNYAAANTVREDHARAA